MNIYLIIYIFLLFGIIIFLTFGKSKKDKFNLFDIYRDFDIDNNQNKKNSVFDINNTGHENDRALKNWKFRRLAKNNFRTYNYNNF